MYTVNFKSFVFSVNKVLVTSPVCVCVFVFVCGSAGESVRVPVPLLARFHWEVLPEQAQCL